eukprot:jgi/Tetstr1/466326/TSEL_010857.t1
MEMLVEAIALQGRENSIFDSNKGFCNTSLFDMPDMGLSVDVSLTVCSPITIGVSNITDGTDFDIPIPGLGGCLCDEDGFSARGFYFQQFGDVSLAASGDVNSTLFFENSTFVFKNMTFVFENTTLTAEASLPFGSCKFCPQGTYQPELAFNCEGLDSCKFCPPGFVPSNFQVNTTLGQEGAAECFKCAPGTYSAGDGTIGRPVPGTNKATCHQCVPGTFTPNFGESGCTLCAPGTAQSRPGQAGCSVCGPGTFSSGGGAKSCEPCRPGTFSPNSGADSCLLCPKGTFTSEFGQDGCAKCPLWNTPEGSIKCTDLEKIDDALEHRDDDDDDDDDDNNVGAPTP